MEGEAVMAYTTKRIRVLVVIDHDGKWEAGGSYSWSDTEARDEVESYCGGLGRPPWGYHWVEADIPVPVERPKVAIEGEVKEYDYD